MEKIEGINLQDWLSRRNINPSIKSSNHLVKTTDRNIAASSSTKLFSSGY
jgi:hypothetical protein